MEIFGPLAVHTPAWLAALLLGAIATLGGALLARERHRKAQRQANRILHALSESITATASPSEIAQLLAGQLPSVSEATSVRLYLHNHKAKSLELVPTREDPDPMAIAVDAPLDGLANGVVKCFVSRATVHIPDVRRNPLVSAGWQPGVALSAMFVPLLARQDRIGVLEVASTKRVGYYSREDQAAVQHLSNQVASSLKLQEQRTVREQLLRSEKLAATAQLISGVADELSEPLDNIQRLAESLSPDLDSAAPPELRQIASESRRASAILARLISFAHPGGVPAQAVDVSALIAGLVHFREPGWKARGLRVQNRLTPEPALTLGARGQLEQLFLNLLVHAEQCTANAAGRTLSLSSGRMGGRIVVEIHYASDAPRESLSEAGDAPGLNVYLDVCRGIAATHGGEIRVVSRGSSAGFEVDLPLIAATNQDVTPAVIQENAAPGITQSLTQSATPEAQSTTSGARSATSEAQSATSGAQGATPGTQSATPGNARGSVPRVSTRTLTLLLVDSDAAARHQLLGMLSTRGHRVIPVPAEQAADLAPRMRFDAVIWAVRSGGPKWSDQQDRIRPAVPAFVLVSDGYDRDLASSLEDSGGFLLARPLQASELDRVLEAVEARTSVRTPA
jgi:signal transduction histidine kinase